ncbi:hypothetical protein J0S82_006650 [Galemys pyrenaicus]|uniref:Uncharacterized protein n=1 Tax=Galemys pyrenaicus TaxID=202257 RepID=A0A8J6A0Z7_GALPY|nr:hypothetical protein J0S82_006650 [Galemys pyrenaicus]
MTATSPATSTRPTSSAPTCRAAVTRTPTTKGASARSVWPQHREAFPACTTGSTSCAAPPGRGAPREGGVPASAARTQPEALPGPGLRVTQKPRLRQYGVPRCSGGLGSRREARGPWTRHLWIASSPTNVEHLGFLWAELGRGEVELPQRRSGAGHRRPRGRPELKLPPASECVGQAAPAIPDVCPGR